MSKANHDKEYDQGYRDGREGGGGPARFFGVGQTAAYKAGFSAGGSDRCKYGSRSGPGPTLDDLFTSSNKEASTISDNSHKGASLTHASGAVVGSTLSSAIGSASGSAGGTLFIVIGKIILAAASFGLAKFGMWLDSPLGWVLILLAIPGLLIGAYYTFILVVFVGIPMMLYECSGPVSSDIPGEWPKDITGGSMNLLAGERSKVWGGTLPGMGVPICFTWAASRGYESVKFIAQVEERGSRSWTKKEVPEGNLSYCNYYGSTISFRITAESATNQKILVGWSPINKNSDIQPGYNNYENLAAFLRKEGQIE
ncbi:MAG: hypothetical protein GZ085_03705 [Sulfuriferula multivorans]|uniref:Uncharacterized protein n=1 Tax=Sulfuriferula multivorans TaxID=1559896 RepID=A0A7C9K9T2_9PROT|nr:hypothetical protein [Sulfuriferula multivorans]